MSHAAKTTLGEGALWQEKAVGMSIDYQQFFARLKGHPANSAPQDAAPTPESGTASPGELGAESALGPKLEKLTGKGLDKADEILSLELDPENGATFGPTLRAQTAVLGHALTTQVRVDEVKLREPRPFKLQELLDRIAEEEKRGPPRLKEVDDSDP
jgi:hypothetical protein